MRTSIEHSGAVNGDARFTFKVLQAERADVSVTNGVAFLSAQITELELCKLIEAGMYALEIRRLREAYDVGKITHEQYTEAVEKMDREPLFPSPLAGDPTKEEAKDG